MEQSAKTILIEFLWIARDECAKRRNGEQSSFTKRIRSHHFMSSFRCLFRNFFFKVSIFSFRHFYYIALRLIVDENGTLRFQFCFFWCVCRVRARHTALRAWCNKIGFLSFRIIFGRVIIWRAKLLKSKSDLMSSLSSNQVKIGSSLTEWRRISHLSSAAAAANRLLHCTRCTQSSPNHARCEIDRKTFLLVSLKCNIKIDEVNDKLPFPSDGWWFDEMLHNANRNFKP